MIDRKARLAVIRDILGSRGGSTQEEIRAHLRGRGIAVSQATLSRDLRELGAVKAPGNNGRMAYRLVPSPPKESQPGSIAWAMSEFGLGSERVGNLLVLRTTPGNARDLCLVLDAQEWREIAGTLAGDDTILIIGRSAAGISHVERRLLDVRGKVRA